MLPAVLRFSSRPARVSSSSMRRLLCCLLVMASPAAAQTAIQGPATAAQPAWDPGAAYITAGQDEPGYRSWYLAAPGRAAEVKTFNDYLVSAQVGGIVPTWQLF